MNIQPRIIVASMVGLSLVGAAYFVSRTNGTNLDPDTLAAHTLSAASYREFITATDTDQDGLPDWQNSLHIATINLEETATTTLTKTAELARYLATQSQASGVSADAILAGIEPSVTAEALDVAYDRRDIVMSDDNSPMALRVYGNRVAAIVLEHAPPTTTEDEMTLLNRAFIRNDPEVLQGLDPTIASYEKMTAAMLALPVPSTLVAEHLSLINVYQALTSDIKAFRGVFSDALPAMLRFRRYPADAQALYAAISALYLKLNERGIQWSDADIASRFITIE